jgi:uncharacterized cupin superfamily protein
MPTIAELNASAATIKAETVARANTATRVGQMFQDIISALSPVVSATVDHKSSVRVATTANITLSGTQTIDGVAVVADERVLVKNQTAPAENGPYVCKAGAWQRATDGDESAEVTSGLLVYVSEGTTNAETYWTLTTADPIVLGTTALTFEQAEASDVAAEDVSSSAGTAGTALDFSRRNHTHRLTQATLDAINTRRATFDTGPFEVNVPNNTILTLYSLNFASLPGQTVPFGATGSDAFGYADIIINEAGADDSGAGSECGCHIRQHWRRRNGGNVETVGLPQVISCSPVFTHLITFTDGNPALMRITKNSSYDSTLGVRVLGELQTRTLADP